MAINRAAILTHGYFIFILYGRCALILIMYYTLFFIGKNRLFNNSKKYYL